VYGTQIYYLDEESYLCTRLQSVFFSMNYFKDKNITPVKLQYLLFYIVMMMFHVLGMFIFIIISNISGQRFRHFISEFIIYLL
jgi:hypothetical protein